MKLIELDYDIEELKEYIQGMSDNEKLEIISEKETYIQSMIEEFEGYLSEISQLKDEIEDDQRTAFYKDVQNALKEAGYNIPWDSNGNLTFKLGGAVVTITLTSENINVTFTSEKHQLSYRGLIHELLTDTKQDGNCFVYIVNGNDTTDVVLKIIEKINGAANKFIDISNK